MEEIAALSEYYYESRYPDELNIKLDSKEVASNALESAAKLVDFVTKKLEE